MRTYTHHIKAIDKSGNQCSFQVSTNNANPITKPVIMYMSRTGLILDEENVVETVIMNEALNEEHRKNYI